MLFMDLFKDFEAHLTFFQTSLLKNVVDGEKST